MRKYFYLMGAVFLLALAVAPIMRSSKKPDHSISMADEGRDVTPPIADSSSIPPHVNLNQCSNKALGVDFLCDYSWEIRQGINGFTYVIDQDPKVMFKIVKIDIAILFVRQLDRDSLDAIGQYKEGFVLEETKVAGLNAIKVKAFSKTLSQARLLDYYFVRNKSLYGLMFSVDPKDRWDDYQFLIQDIVNSFEFR